MQYWWAVALGGACGAVARYLGVAWVSAHLGRAFPWGTLSVNVLGCFLLGFLFVWLVEFLKTAPHWQAVCMTGFVGAFTTFSTFALESLQLAQHQGWSFALLYMGTSLILGLGSLALGIGLGRWCFAI